MELLQETSVPELYNTASGGNKCQLRLLENFHIHEAGIPQALVPLEGLRSTTSTKIVATGELLPARDSDAGAARVAVETGFIVDWCIEYGDKPGVWVMTKVAWYRLGSPSAAYAATYQSLQLRQELAVRCAAALKLQPDAAVEEIQQLVLGGGHGIGSTGRIFDLQQLYDEAPFLSAQMTTLYEAGTFSQQQQQASSGFMPSFLAWLKRQAGIMAAQAAQQAAAAAAAEARAAKRQRLSEPAPAAQQAGYGGGSYQQQAVAGQPSPAAARAPAGAPQAAGAATPGSSSKPGKLKLNMQGAPSGGFKAKIKLKGQILPQAAPAPQDMGSQIQGHPPGADSQGAGQYDDSNGQPHAFKPKLKIAMPKGFIRSAAQGQQQQQHVQRQHSQRPPPAPLQQQPSLPESKASWGCPPQQQLASQRSWDQAGYDQQPQQQQYQQYDQYSGGYAQYHQQYHQQPHHLTAKQQRQAAAEAARQAAAAARAAAAAAKAEEAERRRKEQELQLQMKRQAEYTADIARGMPPAPTRTFRLPAAYVVELLQLWELCQAFGAAFGIPPFSLEQLEAALMPGPLSDSQKQVSAEVMFAAADAQATAAAQKAATDLAAAIAEATGQQQQQQQVTAEVQPAAAAAAQPAAHTAAEPQASARPAISQQQELQQKAEALTAAVQTAAGNTTDSPVSSQAGTAAAAQDTKPGPESAGKAAGDGDAAVMQSAPGAEQSSSPAQHPDKGAAQQGPNQQAVADPHPPQQQQDQQQGVAVKQEQQGLLPAGQESGQSAPASRGPSAAAPPAGGEAAHQPAAHQANMSEPAAQQEQRQQDPQQDSKQTEDVQPPVKQEPAAAEAEAEAEPAATAAVGALPCKAHNADHPAAEAVSAGAAGPAAPVDEGTARVQQIVQQQDLQQPAQAQQTSQQQQQQQQQPRQQQLQQEQAGQQPQQLQQQEQLQQPTDHLRQPPGDQQHGEVQQAQSPPAQQQQQQQQQHVIVKHEQPQVEPHGVPLAAAPAPSTTSAGTTGQAAASNSVGGAAGVSPSVKKHLKFKVKVSGLHKQGSAPLQPPPAAAQEVAAGPAAASAAGTAATPFAAAAAANAAAVEPAAAAAAVLDAAAVAAGALDPAAAAAAVGWSHPGASADTQEQYRGLTLEKAAAAAAAAEAEDAKQQPDVGIADSLSQASSLLLRDVHTVLLRLIDGSAPKAGTKKLRQPLVAKMCPPEGLKQQWQLMSQPHWACRVAYTLAAATTIDKVEFGVQNAATELLTGNYASLSLEARMSVLRALLELALMSETFHAHLDARIEAYTAPKPLRADTFRAFAGVLGASQTGVGRGRGGYRGGGYNEGHPGPSDEAKRSAMEKSERGTVGRMLEEWMEWLSQHEQQSMGLRVPVGVDYRERRYWLLGGASGAWRVFCEEKEGQLWGFYEGAQLLHLAHWIACAAIESELPLLHTLCTMPWPYRPSLVLLPVASAATAAAAAAGAQPPESPGSVAYWAAVATGSNGYGYGSYHLTPAEAGVVPLGPQLFAGLCVPHVQQLMSSWEMAKFRPDGYRGLLAPLLFGEADVPGGSMLASSEARLQGGLYSIVGAMPFYRPGLHSLLQQLGRVLDEAQAASTPEAYTPVLLSLEFLLSHPQMQPAPLSSDWGTNWHQQWRDSLQRCGPSSWEALLLHLSMLGRHVLLGEYAMGREGFMRMVTNCRCPLTFPGVGDEYYILRSAVEAHLDKYMQLPDAATAPLPPAAEELGATAEVVARLPPASCYKVVALAFCSYPMPEALRQQQQPPVAETAATAAAAAAAAADGLDSLLGLGEDEEAAAMHAVGGTSGGTAAGGGATTAAAAAHAMKHNSIASAFDSDGDDIGGLLDFDVDELMNDMDQQHAAQRLHSIPLPPMPHELQQHAAPAAAGGPAAADAQQQQQHPPQSAVPPVPGSSSSGPDGPPEYRPPCMWALLSPVEKGSSSTGNAPGGRPSEPDFLLPERFQQQQDAAVQGAAGGAEGSSRPYIALPFHIDCYLPDYLVSPDLYEAGAERSWLPGDRFNMYVGPKGVRVGGTYYKGTIMSVEEAMDGEQYDPWQSITVLWDNDSGDREHKVSPWQIEPDRDEIQKAAEEQRKAEEAAAASDGPRHQDSAATGAPADDGIATADSAALRGGRRRASRNIDLSSLIGAVDDDDEYNPFADGYSSDSDDGGRRRKGKGKGSGLTWGGDRGTKGSKRGREGDEEFSAAGGEGASSKKAGGRAGGPTRLVAGTGPFGGNQWSMEQIRQQQGTHLTGKQQTTLAALVAGNTALAAQLTAEIPNAPIHEQPFPTPLKAECLAALPCRTQFVTLVADYNISVRGQFSPPMWGNRDLDLYTLFMVVNVRGGYEAVCRTNRWGDVCRSMGCYKDASSGDAMRSCYEKASLVQFEQYVRRGGWEQDRQTARRPQAAPDDQAAAIEQVMRAGKAAAAAPPPPPPPPVPVAPVRPQLIALPAHLANLPLLTQPGGPTVVGLQAGTGQIIVSATPQQFQALQLQLRILAQQQGKAPAAPAAPVVIPAVAGAAGPAPMQQTQAQLLLRQQLLQQAQLQSAAAAGSAGVQVVPVAGAANSQLQALIQQQQLQKAAAARPAVPTVAPTLSGGLTLQQLQQLQQQQQLKPGGAATAPPGAAVVSLPKVGVTPGGGIALPVAGAAGMAAAPAPIVTLPGGALIRPAAGAVVVPRVPGLIAAHPPAAVPVAGAASGAPAQSSAQQALAGTGSMNFSALLDDL